MKLRQVINDPPKDYFNKLAYVESGNNPLAKAKTSSAAGLYQFTAGTWDGLTKQLGLNYTLEDRFDPKKSRKVVEAFTRQNERHLTNRLNREPNEAELYLAHFSGAGGASKFLTALEENPDASVKDIFKDNQIKANKNVFLNKDGSYKKARDIYNWAAKKFDVEELKPAVKEPEKISKRFIEPPVVERDNTAVSSPKIPSLANTPINPTYTGLPEEQKQTKMDPNNNNISEAQLRQILEQERSRQERSFVDAFMSQQNRQEQPLEYEPQAVPNLDHLYNYINVETYANGGQYSIRSGDTLSKIAKRNNLTTNQLLELNPKYRENPNMIRVGDTLTLSREQQTVAEPTVREEKKFDFSTLDYTTPRDVRPSFPIMSSETTRIPEKRFRRQIKPEDVKLDLNNLRSEDEIKRAQKILYYSGYDIGRNKESAIDGKLGRKTLAALEEFKSKSGNRATRKKADLVDDVQNLVPLAARQFIYDTVGGEGELNETSLSGDDYDALKKTVIQNLNKDKFKLDYQDWREARGGSEDTRTDDLNLSNPYSNLQKTLGQASIRIDDKGDIYVEDRYNFNDAGKKENRYKNKFTDEEGLLPLEDAPTFSNKIYRIARNFKTKHGRREGGSPVKIYIGNASDIF